MSRVGTVEVKKVEIIEIFNQGVGKAFGTELIETSGDPLYLPQGDCGKPSRIYFANGFVQSAFHEIAHWCIAGPGRRKLEDYGYWYDPDGRSVERQQEFQKFEAKNQGLEWHMYSTVDLPFHVSFDNLSQGICDQSSFARSIRTNALIFHHLGMPPRARTFIRDVCEYFGTKHSYEKFWADVCQRELMPAYISS